MPLSRVQQNGSINYVILAIDTAHDIGALSFFNKKYCLRHGKWPQKGAEGFSLSRYSKHFWASAPVPRCDGLAVAAPPTVLLSIKIFEHD